MILLQLHGTIFSPLLNVNIIFNPILVILFSDSVLCYVRVRCEQAPFILETNKNNYNNFSFTNSTRIIITTLLIAR